MADNGQARCGDPRDASRTEAFGDQEVCGPALRLVPDTLETLLTRVVTNLRQSLSDAKTMPPGFASACRRDAAAVIDAGRLAGLLPTHQAMPDKESR